MSSGKFVDMFSLAKKPGLILTFLPFIGMPLIWSLAAPRTAPLLCTRPSPLTKRLYSLMPFPFRTVSWSHLRWKQRFVRFPSRSLA